MNLSYWLPCLLLLCTSPVISGEHDGHNHQEHDGHDHHKEKSQSTATLNTTNSHVEMIEDRSIDGKNVIAVPVEAIVSENGKNYVFAQNEKDNTKFDRFEVLLGQSDGDYIEAISGVFPGDTVAIKEEQSFVRQQKDGQTTRPKGQSNSLYRYPDPTEETAQQGTPAYTFQNTQQDNYIAPTRDPKYQKRYADTIYQSDQFQYDEESPTKCPNENLRSPECPNEINLICPYETARKIYVPYSNRFSVNRNRNFHGGYHDKRDRHDSSVPHCDQ